MSESLESWKSIDKQAEYLKEGERLSGLFAGSDDKARQLASGLIQDAAYLYAENKILRAILSETGMVRINPNSPQQQRPVESAKQYRSNCDTYSSIIGRLYRLLDTKQPEEDDDMGDYE